MAFNYDGLTRNAWTGTWSPSGDHPITLSNENRGGIHFITGNTNDELTDIPGQRLQEGMLVYVKNSYGSVAGDKWYTYNLLVGESRSQITGAVPNAPGNWSEFTSGGGGSFSDGDVDLHLNTTLATAGQVLSWNGTDYAWVNNTGGGGGLANVVDDTTPELGGDLDVNGNSIVSSGGQNIMIAPDNYLHLGSGATSTHRVGMYDRFFFPNASPTAGQVLQANATNPHELEWATISSSGGATALGDLTDVSSNAPTTGQVLKWDGTEWAPATDLSSSGGSGIALTDLSVTKASAFGNGNLTYNNSTGVFLFTPPDLSSYSTFSGNYSDLQGLPSLFSGNYNDLTNVPSSNADLGIDLNTYNLNLIDESNNNAILDTVDIRSIAQYLDYTELDNLPTLFSGNYNDLTNIPAIPSLSGYATEVYVQNYVAGLSSDNLTEGSTNLFFNNERVDDRVNALFVDGTGITKTYDDAGNLLTIGIDFTEFDSDDIIEGSVNTYLSSRSTDDIPEGSNNLYYTTSRVHNDISVDSTLIYDGAGQFGMPNSGVTAGVYGSATQIPIVTIDDQGRVTAASTSTVSSDLPIAGDTGTDTVSLLTDTLTIAGGVGVSTSVNNDTVTVDIGQPVGITDDVTFGELTTTEQSKTTITTSNSVVVTQKEIVLAGQTTDATTTEIFLNDGSSTVDIVSGSTAKFKATFVATDGTDTAAFVKTGLIQNISGTTTIIGTNVVETFAEDSGNLWSATITADDANDYLKVEVTGEASKTIDWTVFLEISEVKR